MRFGMDEQGVQVDTQTQPGASLPGRRARPPAPPAVARGEGHSRTISVELDANPSAAGSARGALLAFDSRMERTLMDDLRLLVTELVTNSVRHAESPGRDTVGLDISVDESTIRVEVRDHGAGFAPQPRHSDQSIPGGWGLFLVDQLTDRWGVLCNHITRVWFEIDRGHVRPS
jgi:anti-sigma regulatory factor (Ser/Thr protein kinase)